MNQHVLVLAGGLSYERDVSLRSGRRVAEALGDAGYETTVRDADTALLNAIALDRPDAVFIALHGATGENGALRGVLDLMNIPYIGSDAQASRVAWDKPSAKAKLAQAGINTPEWLTLPQETFRELGASTVLQLIRDSFGLPVMVKPVQGGSGLGAITVHEAHKLPAAMVGCFGYGDTALVERYIPGTHVAVSVIELAGQPTALPGVEIVPADGIYDYAARYEAGKTTWYAPPRLTPELREKLAATAIAAHTALDLRDLSRIDAIVETSGDIQVLGVNVAPGMTETSLLPIAVNASPFTLAEVLHELIIQAIKNRGSDMHAHPAK